MNSQERQQHNALIFGEWLNGADIAALGRKYRHTRRTIEEIVRGGSRQQIVNANQLAANSQKWQANAQQLDALARVNAAQVTYLASVASTYRYFDIRKTQGKQAARAWRRNEREGRRALEAKLKVLAANNHIPMTVFDQLGLLVDVVPMPLAKASSSSR